MATKPNNPKKLANKKTFTTGDVAKILNVSQMSVIKWFNSGKIEGYRVPYSKDRRITRDALKRFVKEHNIPTPDFSFERKLLIIIEDPVLRSSVVSAFADSDEYSVEKSANAYEAGFMLAKLHPDLVILDLSLKGVDSRDVVIRVKTEKDLSHAKIIAICDLVSDTDMEGLKVLGVDSFMRKPFTQSSIVEAAEKLLAD